MLEQVDGFPAGDWLDQLVGQHVLAADRDHHCVGPSNGLQTRIGSCCTTRATLSLAHPEIAAVVSAAAYTGESWSDQVVVVGSESVGKCLSNRDLVCPIG